MDGRLDPPTAEPEATDASRRTYLAAERTYLAWFRSGLAALAVAIGVGRLLPDFTSGARWPFTVLGIGFGILGLLFVWYGVARQRAVDRSLREGTLAPMSGTILLVLAAVGLALALATIALVIAEQL